MDERKEVPLTGGRTTPGIVRIENTVHRPVKEHSVFTQSLLKLLEEKNFRYSPRFLGIDEKGREVLTFIDGVVPHGANELTEKVLVQGAEALKNFHDITAESTLAGSNEVVCHNDLAPWNMVIKDGALIGLIDFDDATPGQRIDDLAYFIWTSLNLGSDVSPKLQAKKIKMICDAYGINERQYLVDAITKQQEKILNKRQRLSEEDLTHEAREFSKSKVPQIQSEITWVNKYKQDLLDNI